MQKQSPWTIFFIVALLAHIVGIISNLDWLQFISKPLLVLFLIGLFYSSTRKTGMIHKRWIFPALLFCWAGDVLLMFQSGNELFFLLGLSAFLLAHIFYCIFFHRVRIAERIESRSFTLIIVAIYYTVLMVLLNPWLGDMKIPVRIYGIVISFMFMLAMHMLFLSNKKAGRQMMIGSLLFVISDSVLAIDKFYYSFEMAGPLIMLTYGMAQWLIVAGSISYLKHKKSDFPQAGQPVSQAGPNQR